MFGDFEGHCFDAHYDFDGVQAVSGWVSSGSLAMNYCTAGKSLLVDDSPCFTV